MNLYSVMDEIGNVLEDVAGLDRVYRWAPGDIQPPAAAVLLPERIAFNATARRGYDRFEGLQVVVAVGAPTTRTAVQAISAFAAGSGAASVVAAIQDHTYADGVTCHVVECTFPNITWGGKPLLAALFSVTVDGPGA